MRMREEWRSSLRVRACGLCHALLPVDCSIHARHTTVPSITKWSRIHQQPLYVCARTRFAIHLEGEQARAFWLLRYVCMIMNKADVLCKD